MYFSGAGSGTMTLEPPLRVCHLGVWVDEINNSDEQYMLLNDGIGDNIIMNENHWSATMTATTTMTTTVISARWVVSCASVGTDRRRERDGRGAKGLYVCGGGEGDIVGMFMVRACDFYWTLGVSAANLVCFCFIWPLPHPPPLTLFPPVYPNNCALLLSHKRTGLAQKKKKKKESRVFFLTTQPNNRLCRSPACSGEGVNHPSGRATKRT